MDTLFGIVKGGVVIAIIFFAIVAAAVIYGLRLHFQGQRREERDKILNSSLDDLAEKKLESKDANGQPTNKNPYSNRSQSTEMHDADPQDDEPRDDGAQDDEARQMPQDIHAEETARDRQYDRHRNDRYK